MKVSVILVNWNGLELTTQALRSLAAVTRGVSWEALVVDNDSSADESKRELPRRFPELALIWNSKNEGFGKACNQAARRARGEYLLFLNNDTVQLEDALTKASAYLDQHPEVGALGIKHLDGSEARAWQPSAFRFPSPWHDTLSCLGLARLVAQAPAYAEHQPADADWVCASFLLVRRSVWQEVGEFDERFFVYDEDIDWCRRAREHGVSILYWPGASMLHLGAASAPGLRDKTFMHFRSRMTYFGKHAAFPWPLVFHAAMSARLGLSLLAQLVKFGLGKAEAVEVAERLRRLGCFFFLRPAQSGLMERRT